MAVASLKLSLMDREVDVRTAAAKALGAMGDATVVPHLAEALKRAGAGPRHEHERMELLPFRMACIDALGEIGGADAIETLIGEDAWGLEHHGSKNGHWYPSYTDSEKREHRVSRQVTAALVRIGTPAIGQLLFALNSYSKRGAATSILERLGASAVPAISMAIRDTAAARQVNLRRNLIRILGEIGTEEAVEECGRITADGVDPNRLDAVSALMRTAKPSAAVWLIGALNTLGAHRHPDHVRSDDPMDSVVQWLGSYGDQRAVGALTDVLSIGGSLNGELRRFAEKALKDIRSRGLAPLVDG